MYRIGSLAERIMTVQFKSEISEEVRLQVVSCSRFLRLHAPSDWTSIVPAIASIDVHIDRGIFSCGKGNFHTHHEHLELLDRLVHQWAETYSPNKSNTCGQVVEIPVKYGGDDGPDLEIVAELCRKTPEEVVRIHSSGVYPVYMIGFMPGFPYLGGMSSEIAVPRKQTPRKLVRAGSVGIAGMQTGIYPLDSPGGWQIIGRTSVQLFQPRSNPPSLLQCGDCVKFVEVKQ